MEIINIPELTSEQMEELCEVAEKTAREYVLSKIPSRRISALNITIETEGTKPISINVDVEITLSSLMKDYDVEKLANQAVKQAFTSIEKRLREFSCKSKK
ncbi:hypothetical protein DRO69_06465 [Candidatus Bathyarchaeota archaeon]|nr:MAG: hypothetical protein DRO69_06465 [Candidatus Bathyarchaeota archaeon]